MGGWTFTENTETIAQLSRWRFPGTTNGCYSTPARTANRISSGPVSLMALFRPTQLTGAVGDLIAKPNCYALYQTGSQVAARFMVAGSYRTYTAPIVLNLTMGFTWVGVTYDPTSGAASFYIGGGPQAGVSRPPAAADWTFLRTVTSDGTGNVANTGDPVYAGAHTPTTELFAGDMAAAHVATGKLGPGGAVTPVLSLAAPEAATNQASFVDVVGNTWTRLGSVPYGSSSETYRAAGETYRFPVNPFQQSIAYSRQVTARPVLSVNGRSLLYEGAINPVAITFDVHTYNATQLAALQKWVRRESPITITDDLGRSAVCYLTKIEAPRRRRHSSEWAATTTVDAITASVGYPAAVVAEWNSTAASWVAATGG